MKNNKSLGQHWLKNREVLDEIADLAADFRLPRSIGTVSASPLRRLTRLGLSQGDSLDEPGSPVAEKGLRLPVTCIEIGPGLGTLTSSLLKRFDKVIAIEFDAKLAENLPKSFPNTSLEVVHADVLQTDFAQLTGGADYVVAGNIPYYITSPILMHFLAAEPKPQRGVFLIQKEVAERVAAGAAKAQDLTQDFAQDFSVAKSSSKKSAAQTLLSLTVQNLAEVALGPVVPAREFTPPPKVDSQVLVLTPREQPQINPAILDFAKIGFASPRKKLSANLASAPALKKLSAKSADAASSLKIPQLSKTAWEAELAKIGVDPNARPGDLSLQDWAKLASILTL